MTDAMTTTNQRAVEEVLPCAHCGGVAHVSSYRSCDCCGMDYNAGVACDGCGATIDHKATDSEAIAAWNRRTPQPDKAGVGKMVQMVGPQMMSFPVGTSINYENGVMHITPPPPGAGEDRRDAERYRWLRSQVRWELPNQRDSWTTPSGVYLVATMVSAVYGNCDEQTDTAIDAAMRGEGNG